jgi:hypothetical protein
MSRLHSTSTYGSPPLIVMLVAAEVQQVGFDVSWMLPLAQRLPNPAIPWSLRCQSFLEQGSRRSASRLLCCCLNHAMCANHSAVGAVSGPASTTGAGTGINMTSSAYLTSTVINLSPEPPGAVDILVAASQPSDEHETRSSR